MTRSVIMKEHRTPGSVVVLERHNPDEDNPSRRYVVSVLVKQRFTNEQTALEAFKQEVNNHATKRLYPGTERDAGHKTDTATLQP